MFFLKNFNKSSLKNLEKLVWFNIKSFFSMNFCNRLFSEFLCGNSDKLKYCVENQPKEKTNDYIFELERVVVGIVDIFKSNAVTHSELLSLPYWLYILIIFIMISICWFLYLSIFSLDRLEEIETLHFYCNLNKNMHKILWAINCVVCFNNFIGLLLILINIFLWYFSICCLKIGYLLFIIKFMSGQSLLVFLLFIILKIIVLYNLVYNYLRSFLYFDSLRFDFDFAAYKKTLLSAFLALIFSQVLILSTLFILLCIQHQISLKALITILTLMLSILLIFYIGCIVLVPAIYDMWVQHQLKKKEIGSFSLLILVYFFFILRVQMHFIWLHLISKIITQPTPDPRILSYCFLFLKISALLLGIVYFS